MNKYPSHSINAHSKPAADFLVRLITEGKGYNSDITAVVADTPIPGDVHTVNIIGPYSLVQTALHMAQVACDLEYVGEGCGVRFVDDIIKGAARVSALVNEGVPLFEAVRQVDSEQSAIESYWPEGTTAQQANERIEAGHVASETVAKAAKAAAGIVDEPSNDIVTLLKRLRGGNVTVVSPDEVSTTIPPADVTGIPDDYNCGDPDCQGCAIANARARAARMKLAS